MVIGTMRSHHDAKTHFGSLFADGPLRKGAIMLKIRSHRVALSLAFLLSVLAFGANSFATCEKGCTYFEIAIANVTPDTHPYGTYCLEFDDSDRGGHIYTSIGSDLINGDSETDSCKVYRVEDCHVSNARSISVARACPIG